MTDNTVKMDNDTVLRVMGLGSVKITNEDNFVVILTKVRYIHEMKRNLISLGTMEALGCRYSSSDGVLKITKDERVVLQGRRQETLYFLCEKGKSTVSSACTSVVKEDETRLWHSRMAHMCQRGLDVLVKRGLMNCKEVSSLKFCEDCIFGKSHRLKFPKGKHTSVSTLDYIHTDLWGSSYVPKSHGRCQYFLVSLMIIAEKYGLILSKGKMKLSRSLMNGKS